MADLVGAISSVMGGNTECRTRALPSASKIAEVRYEASVRTVRPSRT